MEPLVIVGASARAAAFSALRGGYQPFCADLFADADLAARCTVLRVEDYPQGLARALAQFPSAAWLYTGGLENCPSLVDAMAAARPLVGNSGSVLRQARDPRRLSEALQQEPCRFPDWRPTAIGLPRDGSWLRKGYRSSGGLQVEPWHESAADRVSYRHYFQQRVEGRSAAAVYIATRGRSLLLGATEQLLKRCQEPFYEMVPDTFMYAGSLGPLRLEDGQHAALTALGERLAGEFQLQGIFGVDVLLSADGVYAVDLNPRYPASAEVLECLGGFSAVHLHVQACGHGVLPVMPTRRANDYMGKAILYADRSCVVSAAQAHLLQAAMGDGDWPAIADVPAEGSRIEANGPVMTVFARAESWSLMKQRLQAAIERWRAR